MEEAEEAEPDEEFKDAIEVGGPSPAPSTDQARSWVVQELCGFSHPKSGFLKFSISSEKMKLALS